MIRTGRVGKVCALAIRETADRQPSARIAKQILCDVRAMAQLGHIPYRGSPGNGIAQTHSVASMYEIDHVLICASVGGTEAEQLIAFGLTEGSRNRHPGQGTANRRFFFENAMLELLWVEDREEVMSDGVRRLGLWERWSQRDVDASPFGICYRPKNDTTLLPPFESWSYSPSYAPITIAVAVTSTNPHEPLLFYLPYLRKVIQNEPCTHAAGIHRLSSALITGPTMELTFDEGVQRLRHDFRPGLPLTICW